LHRNKIDFSSELLDQVVYIMANTQQEIMHLNELFLQEVAELKNYLREEGHIDETISHMVDGACLLYMSSEDRSRYNDYDFKLLQLDSIRTISDYSPMSFFDM
jgi:hypothetical protein